MEDQNLNKNINKVKRISKKEKEVHEIATEKGKRQTKTETTVREKTKYNSKYITVRQVEEQVLFNVVIAIFYLLCLLVAVYFFQLLFFIIISYRLLFTSFSFFSLLSLKLFIIIHQFRKYQLFNRFFINEGIFQQLLFYVTRFYSYILPNTTYYNPDTTFLDTPSHLYRVSVKCLLLSTQTIHDSTQRILYLRLSKIF